MAIHRLYVHVRRFRKIVAGGFAAVAVAVAATVCVCVCAGKRGAFECID